MTYLFIGYIYALKENYPEVIKNIDQLINIAPSLGIKVYGHWWKGFYYYWFGSLNQSLKELRVAADQAEEMESEFWKAGIEWMKGWIYYDRGELERSMRCHKKWFDLIIESDPLEIPDNTASYNFYLGLVDLKQGRIDSAKSRLAKMKSLLPDIKPRYKNKITFSFDILQGEI